MTAPGDPPVAPAGSTAPAVAESELRENSILAWYRGESRQTFERILRIDRASDTVYVIALKDDQAWPEPRARGEMDAALEAADAVVVPEAEVVDAAEYVRLHAPDDDYYARIAGRTRRAPRATDDRERAKRAWEAVKCVDELPDADAFDPAARGPKVREAMRTFGFTRPTMHTYLRRFWQGGQIPTALRPRYDLSGGPGRRRFVDDPTSGNKRGRKSRAMLDEGRDDGVNVTRDYERKICQGLALFHRDGASLTDAWQETKKRFFAPGVETIVGLLGEPIDVPVATGRNQAPSLQQFRLVHYRNLERPKALTEELKKQEGKRAFDARRRARTGNSTVGVLGPGYLYQIDATIADLYIVARWRREYVINRPTIYLIVDVFSRMIVGFSVSLVPPSWAGALVALENAMTDKVSSCGEFGIAITREMWPVTGVPRQILGDRGEMISHPSAILTTEFGIHLTNTPPYRPDWKGIIERYFRLMNDRIIHTLPAAVRKTRERGERDPRLDATLTLHEFRQLLILGILEHNETTLIPDYPYAPGMIADGVHARPLDLWRWGIANSGGKLRDMDEDIVRYKLLPKKQATVTQDGILLDGMGYGSTTYDDDDWGVRAGARGAWTINVAQDPRTTDVAYWQKADGRIERFALLPRDNWRAGWDLEEVYEHKAVTEADNIIRQARVDQAKHRYDADRTRILAEAKAETERALVGQRPRGRLDDISAHGQAERDMDGRERAFDLAPQGAPGHPSGDDDGYVPAPSRISLLYTSQQEGNDHVHDA